MVTYTDDINSYFRLFQDELDSNGNNYSPTWPEYRSATAIALLKDRVAKSGSLPSISGFIIAFDALVKAGTIRPIRAAQPIEPEQHALTVQEYNALPANEIIRRYRSDIDFKASVDRLIVRGEI